MAVRYVMDGKKPIDKKRNVKINVPSVQCIHFHSTDFIKRGKRDNKLFQYKGTVKNANDILLTGRDLLEGITLQR